MKTEFPDVMAVSASYAQAHMGELTAFVRDGGYVRILDLKRGADTWLRPDAPAGVVPDLTLHRARRERGLRMNRSRTARRRAG